jgi:hypothetical protein
MVCAIILTPPVLTRASIVHLDQGRALARSLGLSFESGAVQAHLFDTANVSDLALDARGSAFFSQLSRPYKIQSKPAPSIDMNYAVE